MRQGLGVRPGKKVTGAHPVASWMVEHAADVLSTYEVGVDGRVVYEIMKGNLVFVKVWKLGNDPLEVFQGSQETRRAVGRLVGRRILRGRALEDR